MHKQMAAGDELDALVAERVMGWAVRLVEKTRYRNNRYVDPRPTGQYRQWVIRPDGARYICPRFSTDIADAFQVVKKMRQSLYTMTLELYIDGDANVSFTSFPSEDGGSGDEFDGYAWTVPHAICLAALEATKEAPTDG